MKYFKYFLIPFLFIVLSAKSQTKNINNGTALQYFIKEYLFKGDSNKSYVFIPIEAEDIPDMNKFIMRRELKFWSILLKYYPEFSIDDLEKMITGSPIIDKNMINNLPNVIILNQPELYTSKFNYYELRKKFNDTAFCRISNIIYSKDKKTCILYVSIPQAGSFTVEIKMDDSGQWNSIIYTQETMA
jgi:hypothetical protein